MYHSSTVTRSGKSLITAIIVTIAMLPVAPISSMADDAKSDDEVVVLKDQSKTESESPQAETAPATDSTEDSSDAAEAAPEEEKKGMSTGKKVAIGVGTGVVVIAGAAALSGGSGSSSPTPPTPEQMVGAWQANANSADGRTYTGTYTLYAGGSHTYDLYISDGRHKVGNGSWKLVDYNLTLRNYSGSTYNGTFAEGVKNTVTLGNTAGTWKLVITK